MLLKMATDSISAAQDRQAKYANQHRRDDSFDVGDRVLLSTKNLQLQQASTKKFLPRFLGPFKVGEVVSPVAYKLELPDSMKIYPVFHSSLLTRYMSDSGDLQRTSPMQPPAPVIVDDQPEFEVERILDRRVYRGKIQYLVNWLGFSEYDSTWEPVHNLTHSKQAIQSFETSLPCVNSPLVEVGGYNSVAYFL